MTREPDPTGFDAIVAAWRAEGNVPQWPDDPQLDEPAADARTGVDTDAPADRAPADRAPTDRAPTDRPDERPDERRGRLFDADAQAPSRHHPDPDAGSHADPRRDGPDADDPDRACGGDPGGRSRARGREADPDVDGGDPRAEDATDQRGRDGEHPRGAAGRDGDPRADDAADGSGATGAERGRPARAGAAQSPPEQADEHFVPPDPPPLPRMGPPILVGLTLIGLGLVLVTFPGWVGVPQVYGLPLGLVAIAAGLGWLVLRLWPDPDDVPPPLYLDDPDDPDGGAVL